jgi:GTPase
MLERKESRKEPERAVLIGLISENQTSERLKEFMDELAFLSETANIIPVKRFTQKLVKPDVRTFIGSGKLNEINTWADDHEVKLLIFDDELSPSQVRNIEKITKKKVIDRTWLILEIFEQRAQTAHARTQVELALYEYLLPRLVGMWTHLERQRGGTGTRGGAGEKEIETDRRIIRNKISLLKDKLKSIDKQMATQRKSRGEFIRVALVGYTNVGKSTLMNVLSKSEVFAENKLFATLDTTTRKVILGNLPFLLSDTVGFIRKLPHQLVESFKSTLDEVREADLLLHVVDISHPQYEDQISVVNQTLAEIGVSDKPTILVFNKVDAYRHITQDPQDAGPPEAKNMPLAQLEKYLRELHQQPCVFISALSRENLENFRSLVYDKVKAMHVVRYPYNNLLY